MTARAFAVIVEDAPRESRGDYATPCERRVIVEDEPGHVLRNWRSNLRLAFGCTMAPRLPRNGGIGNASPTASHYQRRRGIPAQRR